MRYGLMSVVLFLMFLSAHAAQLPLMPPTTDTTARLAESYGQLPLSFEINQGQSDKTVNFLSRGWGYTLFLTPTEAVLALRKPVAKPGAKAEKRREAYPRYGIPAQERVSGLAASLTAADVVDPCQLNAFCNPLLAAGRQAASP